MPEHQYSQCYHCGSNEYHEYDSENGYNLVKCNHCGLLYVNPRPGDEEIDLACMTGMHRGDHLLKIKTSYNTRKIAKYLKILGDFYYPDDLVSNSSNWHDIGCGTGEFLFALQRFSKNALIISGSEPNLQKVEIARNLGLNVSTQNPLESGRKFYYISLLNVFSHLPDPVVTLSEWKDLLYPGGELFIETGHSCHLPRKIHHRPYYLPDHLSFANQEIVVSILKRMGFQIMNIKIYRGEMYPLEPLEYFKYLGINMIRRKFSIQNILPKEPDRDMFIRAVLP